MDGELTKEEKERLLQKISDVMFNCTLMRSDAVEILDVCLRACKREKAQIEEATRPDCRTVQ